MASCVKRSGVILNHLLFSSGNALFSNPVSASNGTKFGFVGCGQMGTALAKGMVQNKFTTAENIVAMDKFESSRDLFKSNVGGGVVTTASLEELARLSDVVLLCVKPQIMKIVLSQLAKCISSKHLIISIAAGVKISFFLEQLGADTRVIRVMPNTPCLVGQTAAAFSPGGKATQQDIELTSNLLKSVGISFQVDEKLLDAVTGVSGSGPAYVYQLIESMSDAGVLAGLPRDVATPLAVQTVLGAATMVKETGEHPAVLKGKVTSPGGTTIAGLYALEQGGFNAAVMNAVKAAADKSYELGAK
eukprot:CAMPEP_0174257704 /NCGR_PEP_ID=MMETSP0439-20130205/6820_1 /TAXON_ID=0 /ORGANISM="Stereomyxa ramosa, Strain Chinc5" /LENGTH=302 /DNA_ID=CAMNT_0015340915 /DNA_START=23 /DNA_END=931 /DNA_ORIENTATION=-